MKHFRLYADGASSGKSDQPGGYGWILLDEMRGELVGYSSGAHRSTTNNVMELTGVIKGLEYVLKASGNGGNRDDEVYFPLLGGPRVLTVISDSQYALNVLAGNWIPNTNVDLIKQGQLLLARLDEARISVRLQWVRGHAGEEWQERVDYLATRAKEELKASLGYGKLYQGHGLPPKEMPIKG